jgi:HEAT repeat protein
LDTPTLREALFERLTDSDDDTRGEAMVGLANRRDRRVVPAIAKELASDCVGSLAVEAAGIIAAPELHPELIALREWWDVNDRLLVDAIQACSPEG